MTRHDAPRAGDVDPVGPRTGPAGGAADPWKETP